MVRAGVPLPDALPVTADGTNNVVFRRGLDEVRERDDAGRGPGRPDRPRPGCSPAPPGR